MTALLHPVKKKIDKFDYQRSFHGFKGRSSVYTTGCLSFFWWGRCWFALVLLKIVFWLKNKINRISLFIYALKLIFGQVQENVAGLENSANFVDCLKWTLIFL